MSRISIDGSLEQVARLLRERYLDHGHHNQEDPLDELVYIIISTKTREHRYRPAYKTLREHYPTNEELAGASKESLTELLSTTGLAEFKVKTIKNSLSHIYRNYGCYNLSWLAELDDEECERILTEIPGVGLKIARCVLMCSLGRAVFPVDINVWRVAKRLGWTESTQRYANRKQMNDLQDLVPEDLRYSLHVNMLSLGRDVCLPGKPDCSLCVISGHCRSSSQK